MQEYIIEIWHLISVSLNIKRAPPINTGLLRLLQLDENMCVFVCDCVFIQKAYACRLYSIRKCWTCKWIKRIIQECEAAVARARKKINGWREEKKKRTRSAHIHIYTKNMLVLMLTMRSLKSIDFYITHSHSRWLSLLKLPCSFSARLLHVGRSFARCRPRSSFPLSLSSAFCTPRHRHHQGKTKSREKSYPNRYSNLSDELTAYNNNCSSQQQLYFVLFALKQHTHCEWEVRERGRKGD